MSEMLKREQKERVPEACRSKLTSGSSKARVLKLDVPMCIRYRAQLRCKSNNNSALGVASKSNGGHSSKHDNSSVNGDNGGNRFNLRCLFTEKVY